MIEVATHGRAAQPLRARTYSLGRWGCIKNKNPGAVGRVCATRQAEVNCWINSACPVAGFRRKRWVLPEEECPSPIKRADCCPMGQSPKKQKLRQCDYKVTRKRTLRDAHKPLQACANELPRNVSPFAIKIPPNPTVAAVSPSPSRPKNATPNGTHLRD